MSDGDYQREGRPYFPFDFEGKIIDANQYIICNQLIKEYELEEEFREYGRELCEL